MRHAEKILATPEEGFSLGDVAFGLEAALARTEDGTISLDSITLSRLDARAVVAHLQSPGIKKRLVKLANQPGIPNPVMRVVGGALARHCQNDKAQIARAVDSLESQLPDWLEAAKKLPASLMVRRLRECQEYVEEAGTESILRQLVDHPLCLRGPGVVVDLRNPGERRLIRNFMEILRSLKDPSSAETLKDWIRGEMKRQNADECLDMVTGLVRLAMFLDNRTSVEQLSVPGGEISLLPYRSLNEAVVESHRELSELGYDHRTVQKLAKLEKEIELRYHQVIHGPLKDHLSVKQLPLPEPKMLAEAFSHWCLDCDHLPPARAGLYGAEFLRNLGYSEGEIGEFCQEVRETLSDELGDAIELEAVRLGLIPTGRQEVFERSFHNLVDFAGSHPDLANLNFAERMPEVTGIDFYLIPGSLGPAHVGHRFLLEELFAFCDFSDRTHGKDPARKRVFVLLPTPDTLEELPGRDKPIYRAGMITERIAVVASQMADLAEAFPEVTDAFITLKLQPNPAETKGRIAASLGIITERILDKVGKDYAATTVPQCNFHLAVGVDELRWLEERRGQLVLDKRQPDKFSLSVAGKAVDVVVLARQNFLSSVLNAMDDFPKKANQVGNVVIAMGDKMSSTRIAHAVGRGRPIEGMVTESTRAYITKLWSQGAQEERQLAIDTLVLREGKISSEGITRGLLGLALLLALNRLFGRPATKVEIEEWSNEISVESAQKLAILEQYQILDASL